MPECDMLGIWRSNINTNNVNTGHKTDIEDEVLLDDLPISKELKSQVINANYQNINSSRDEEN